jgi:hypothetical protein
MLTKQNGFRIKWNLGSDFKCEAHLPPIALSHNAYLPRAFRLAEFRSCMLISNSKCEPILLYPNKCLGIHNKIGVSTRIEKASSNFWKKFENSTGADNYPSKVFPENSYWQLLPFFISQLHSLLCPRPALAIMSPPAIWEPAHPVCQAQCMLVWWLRHSIRITGEKLVIKLRLILHIKVEEEKKKKKK